MGATASQITHGTLDANVVISANSIRVESIFIGNTSGAAVAVTLQKANGDALYVVPVADDGAEDWNPNALFEDGLTAVSAGDAAVTITVTHSSSLGGA